jgi:hypothetical protein
MTPLDFTIELIWTVAGWAAILLGLAWALGRARRCDLHFHLPPAGGDRGGSGGGGRPAGTLARPVLGKRHSSRLIRRMSGARGRGNTIFIGEVRRLVKNRREYAG